VASLRPNGIKPLVRFEVEGLPGCQHDFGQVDVHFSQGYIRFSAAKDETVNSLVRRGGIILLPVVATSFVSVAYGRASAVASVSAVPSSLSFGHRKCPKKATSVTNPDLLVEYGKRRRMSRIIHLVDVLMNA
jgi:hypothetical protein